MKKYDNEKQGQIDFFNNYKQYISTIKDKKLEDILLLNTDGVVGGNILEFKLQIKNYNEVLFQAIKYLSKARINGIPIPANILLVSLNDSKIYKFNSIDFLDKIEKVYIGASSKDNSDFINIIQPENIDISKDVGSARLIELLRQEEYTKINITEDCIIGWAKKYYTDFPNGSKGSFLGSSEYFFSDDGEIRNPNILKKYIHPYKETHNEKFKYLMDTLNDRLLKKELGAFYTPIPYVKMATELVREAIKLVPQGNDFIILDRCAGTGNLEEFLTEEELKHCVLSTYEYYEYQVLKARLGDKVKYILPPESKANYVNGKILNADALSEDYINNEYLRNIVDNPRITIILLENPPYQDSSSDGIKGDDADIRNSRKSSYVYENMKKLFDNRNKNTKPTRELSNLFIWSAFHYYLRQPTDSYIVFSPVKYFKSVGLGDKLFKKGYIFNRKYFHASPSAISCIWWQNIPKQQEEFNLQVYDIEINKSIPEKQEQINQGRVNYIKDIIIKKVYNNFLPYYDKQKGSVVNDKEIYVYCGTDGMQRNKVDRKGQKSYFNDSIIGYLRSINFAITPLNNYLTRLCFYIDDGFYLRTHNYIEKLPLFCAKLYPQNNFYERDVYFTTSDGGGAYLADKDFVKSCFIYSCLSPKNKCRSFFSTDGNLYKNELCFDDNTRASLDLSSFVLTKDDEVLINSYKSLLKAIKDKTEYNNKFSYGLFQINEEINVFTQETNKKKIYNYPEIYTEVEKIKLLLKQYYNNNILDKLFKYELLK